MRAVWRKFISAIVIAVMVGQAFAGCKGMLQPSCSALVEMNSFIDEAHRLSISIELIDKGFSMRYDSAVTGSVEETYRCGQATVYFMNTYFFQQCETYYSDGISAKKWRGKWVETEFTSPFILLENWQTGVAEGEGYYPKRSVMLSDYGISAQNGENIECFRINLSNAPLEWQSLCDVNLDSLFGGTDRFKAAAQADVELLYSTDELTLVAVIVTFEDEDTWLHGSILVEPTDDDLQMEINVSNVEGGLLNEEWEIAVIEEE